MSRELLVALIKKDLEELSIMLDGISEMQQLPTPISKLAISKANNIVTCLTNLSSAPATPIVTTPTAAPTATIVQPQEEAKRQEVAESANTQEPIAIKEEELTPTIEDTVAAEVTAEPLIEEQVTETPIAKPAHEAIETHTQQQENSAQCLNDTQHTQQSLNEAIAGTEPTRVETVISHKKIADISQAISIGDRFRYQRELFANSGEKMLNTLQHLNQLNSYEEAINYLKKEFNWAADNSAANDFIDLLKRKF